MNIADLDRFMALRPAPEEGVRWLAPFEPPLALEGLPFFVPGGPYRRLPLDTEPLLVGTGREAINRLSRQTAGACLRFSSNTGRVWVKVRLEAPCGMYHMPATGQGGFDCYLRRPGGEWRYGGVARFDPGSACYTSALWSGGDRGEKEFLLHFPLYMGVEEAWIGVEEDASLAPPSPRTRRGLLAVYGTSIDQGGCASHPGMAFPAILGRALDMETYNLGFSGNGCLEPELADVLVRTPGLRLAVIDTEANAAHVGLLHRLPEFLARLRRGRPEVSVLVVSSPDGPLEAQDPEKTAQRDGWREAQRRAAEAAGAAFLDGRALWPGGGDACTVDGAHPTDLGFALMARNLRPVVEKLLEAAP